MSTTVYDEVAYPGSPHPDARPSRMAAIAALLGVQAPSPHCCRVLEIGVGDGAHLIPLALEQPESSFFGIDLAAQAIARGRERADSLGVRNLRLEHRDLSTFDDAEPFDYIIAHGVYSWVPPDVQDALLRLCRRLLTPNGLAYLSYATYPGCHAREMVRNLMLFHTSRLEGGTPVVEEGLEFLRFVMQHQTAGDAYGKSLEREHSRMSTHPLGYAFHDDFAEHNSPVYFGELVERAQEQQLDFFAEGLFVYFDDLKLPAEALATIERLSEGDDVTREQYLDFLRGRAFRQTLFCHSGQRRPRVVELPRLLPLHAASRLKSSTPEAPLEVAVSELFESGQGAELKVEHPLVRAAFRQLAAAWPRAVPVSRLCEDSEAAVKAVDLAVKPSDRQLLLGTLLRAAAVKLVELDVAPPDVAAGVSAKPRASELSRLEAQQGKRVTDLWHRQHTLEDDTRALLTVLDGTRDHAALAEHMHAYFAAQPGAEPRSREQIARELETVLAGMQRRALLRA